MKLPSPSIIFIPNDSLGQDYHSPTNWTHSQSKHRKITKKIATPPIATTLKYHHFITATKIKKIPPSSWTSIIPFKWWNTKKRRAWRMVLEHKKFLINTQVEEEEEITISTKYPSTHKKPSKKTKRERWRNQPKLTAMKKVTILVTARCLDLARKKPTHKRATEMEPLSTASLNLRSSETITSRPPMELHIYRRALGMVMGLGPVRYPAKNTQNG